VTKLAEFALSQPQACYAAFTYGLKHRWTYFLRTLPDLEDLLAPLERAIADVLIPSITGDYCTQGERELLALPVRMGGMGLTNPSQEAASVKNRYLKDKLDQVKGSVSRKTLRAVDLATQKGASSWLTVLPIRDMNFDLNKSEFRYAVKLKYDWDVPDMPSVCVCEDHFNVDHAMICKRSGFVIQRHNELRDLQAEMLRMVCNGVETEPVLQDITGEELNRGANTAPDARLDIVAREFWERQRSAFFDVRICNPNADSYRDMDLNQIYRQHETEKKRQYASRVLEVEKAIFTPLVFSTTGGMAAECKRYHSRLAELLATKKGESYATTMSWIRARVSFALLRSALLCLRGSRAKRRIHLELPDIDFDIERGHANIR